MTSMTSAETYTGNLPTYGENDRIDVAGDFVLITNSWRGTHPPAP